MKSSVAVIGDLDTIIGFQLGGVKVSKVVETNEDAKNALDESIENDISIIIITEKIADNIREYINKKVGSDVLPMIIEIPDKYGSSDRGSNPIEELIKRVIGVEMVK
jgi:V/A-type H+-transporting ATPase subunit F